MTPNEAEEIARLEYTQFMRVCDRFKEAKDRDAVVFITNTCECIRRDIRASVAEGASPAAANALKWMSRKQTYAEECLKQMRHLKPAKHATPGEGTALVITLNIPAEDENEPDRLESVATMLPLADFMAREYAVLPDPVLAPSVVCYYQTPHLQSIPKHWWDETGPDQPEPISSQPDHHEIFSR